MGGESTCRGRKGERKGREKEREREKGKGRIGREEGGIGREEKERKEGRGREGDVKMMEYNRGREKLRCTSIMVSSLGAMVFSTSSFSLLSIMGFKIWCREEIKRWEEDGEREGKEKVTAAQSRMK